jgi:ribosome-binding protein aMBF1 (putative translation factor)
MTIYWTRCSICGKHKPTLQCTINGRKINVCASCYFLLGLWEKCVEKSWGEPGGLEEKERAETDKLREIEKLLEKLE